VTVETIVEYLRRNAAMACAIVRDALPRIAMRARTCECATALRSALLTEASAIPDRRRGELSLLIGKYIS
jgi:5'-methylthioadenosine phosphorylase